MIEKKIKIVSKEQIRALCGRYDENLKYLHRLLSVQLYFKDGALFIQGEEEGVSRAYEIIGYLLRWLGHGSELTRSEIATVVQALAEDRDPAEELKNNRIQISSRKGYVTPKTEGQERFIRTIDDYDIVFCIGLAGTGKTYLAMAKAVSYLLANKVRRIILTRPAVEAGESLGFLPGDLNQKLAPYLRPLYDALYEMLPLERIEEYIEVGVIEVAPLAYMRGRTLNESFIILDEAQNCRSDQMKMFLTRLGFDSKVVITADMTQTDLPEGRPVGLLEARELLEGIPGIRFSYLTGEDVVRHELVQRIIEAYENKAKT